MHWIQNMAFLVWHSPNNPFLYRTESGRSLNPSVRMWNPCQGCQHGGHPAAWWGVPTTASPLLARGEERPCWEEGGQNSTVTSASGCVSHIGPLVVFQHRASGLQCFNIGLWWKCFMPKSAAMLLVPPHKAHNSQHVSIVYPANIDPLSQEHNSRQFPFISSDHPWSKH